MFCVAGWKLKEYSTIWHKYTSEYTFTRPKLTTKKWGKAYDCNPNHSTCSAGKRESFARAKYNDNLRTKLMQITVHYVSRLSGDPRK